MAKQAGYRKFGEAKIACNAGEGMAKHMRGHALKFCLPTNTVQYSDDADEVSVAPVGWKDEERIRTGGLGFDTVHRSFSQRSDLFPALGVGKANAVIASTEPRPPSSQHLHPRSGTAEFVFAQSALSAPDSKLPHALGGIPANDAHARSMAEQCP